MALLNSLAPESDRLRAGRQLTRLPSLEILDVSRNRIRALPLDIGCLINLTVYTDVPHVCICLHCVRARACPSSDSLQVLAMAKNKLNALPTYISDMKRLKVLKVDHNPITFPPKEVWELNEDANRDTWLEGVKRFLRRQPSEPTNSRRESESGSRYYTRCFLHLPIVAIAMWRVVWWFISLTRWWCAIRPAAVTKQVASLSILHSPPRHEHSA